MLIQIQGLLSTIGILDVIDIAVVAYFLYTLYHMLIHTRAATLIKGLPFRQAHEVVGKCVAYAILNNKFLPEITLAEYKEFSDLFEEDLLVALEPYNCVAARKSYGGPAFTENEKQFAIGDEVIAAQEKTLAELQANL